MLKVHALAMLVSLMSATDRPAEPRSAAGELYAIISENVHAPERRGCANKQPFAVGYKCDGNDPAFRFERGQLTIDDVDLSGFETEVKNWFSFLDGNCVDYRDLEALFRERRRVDRVKFLRSDGWSMSEGGGSGPAEDYRFGGAKIVVEHHYDGDDTNAACITAVLIDKRIR